MAVQLKFRKRASSMAESFTIHLPNLLEISKGFPLTLNPHFDADLLEQSKLWIRQYTGQREAHFFQDDLELLSAYAFPLIDRERLSLIVDYNNYLFLTDELAEGSEEVAKKFSKTVLRVLDSVDEEAENVIGLATKDILIRIRSMSRPYEFQWICDNFRHYIETSNEEAKRQRSKIILDLETYRKHRPILAGCEIWYTLAIVANDVKIPQEMYENEFFMKVHDSASEMLWIGNDVYSFAKEYRRNVYDTNLVTIIMKAQNCSMQESFDEIGRIYQDHQHCFEENKLILLRTVNHPEVNRFVECLETFIIGNLEWSATTTRYSSKEEHVKNTHKIKLYKKHEF